MNYFDFGKLESCSIYDLLSIGFWPVLDLDKIRFDKQFPECNPYPSIEFCGKLEYRCRTNHNKHKMNFIADYLGFTAEKDFDEDDGAIWEIKNFYGEAEETYKLAKVPANPKNNFIHRFKKNYTKYVISFPIVPHFLYLITSHNKAGYKIGITNNPESRLKTIGTQLPFLASIIRLYPMPKKNAINMEKFYHFIFKSKHLNGEWFDLDLNDIDLTDYIFSRRLIAAEPHNFEKFLQIIKKYDWLKTSVEFWNNLFRVDQEDRHYMTLMNSFDYSNRLRNKEIVFD